MTWSGVMKPFSTPEAVIMMLPLGSRADTLPSLATWKPPAKSTRVSPGPACTRVPL